MEDADADCEIAPATLLLASDGKLHHCRRGQSEGPAPVFLCCL